MNNIWEGFKDGAHVWLTLAMHVVGHWQARDTINVNQTNDMYSLGFALGIAIALLAVLIVLRLVLKLFSSFVVVMPRRRYNKLVRTPNDRSGQPHLTDR